jgi:hypothetical protein
MTGKHHKASLKRNQQQSESKTDKHSNRTQAIRSSTGVSESELIPAQKEAGDNDSGCGSDRAQGDLRELAGKSRTQGHSQYEHKRANEKEK